MTDSFLSTLSEASGEQRRLMLRNEMLKRWISGEQVRVEDWCEMVPSLRQESSILLDLIALEVELRRDQSESPTLSEYVNRFPHLSAGLQLLFALRPLEEQSALPSPKTEPQQAVPVAKPVATKPPEKKSGLAWMIAIQLLIAAFLARVFTVIYQREAQSANHLATLFQSQAEEAQEKLKQAAYQRTDDEWKIYAGQIQLAASHRSAERYHRARQILSGTSKAKRGWEYRYLLAHSHHPRRVTLANLDHPIQAIGIDPAGAFFYSINEQGRSRKWNILSGTSQVEKLEVEPGCPVAYSADRRLLAIGKKSGSIRLINAQNGDEIRLSVGHDGAVTEVAISQDGKLILSAGADGSVILRSIEGRELHRTKGYAPIAFRPDGQSFALQREEGIEIVDVETFTTQRIIRDESPVRDLCYDSESLLLASVHSQQVSVWRLSDGERLKSYAIDSPRRARFSPDGRWLAVSRANEVLMIDLRTEQRNHLSYSSKVTSFAFFPEGQRFLIVTDRGLHVQSLRAPAVKKQKKVELSSIASPDESRTLTIEKEAITVRERATHVPLLTIPLSRADEIRVYSEKEWSFQSRLAKLRPLISWHEEQAKRAERIGDWRVASFHLLRLVQQRRDDASLRLRLAYALSRKGRPIQGLRQYLRAMLMRSGGGLWPVDGQAKSRGTEQARSGNWKEAALDFELATHQNGATVEVWESLLLTHLALDRRERAQTLLAQVLRLRPSTPLLRRCLSLNLSFEISPMDLPKSVRAAAWYRVGQYDRARRILDQQKRSAWDQFFFAMTLRKLEMHREAEQALLKAKEQRPKSSLLSWKDRLAWHVLESEATKTVLLPTQMTYPAD